MSTHAGLFSSIVHSTIWREPHPVRIVWITMLAIADRKTGIAQASVPGLADLARVTILECEGAILVLQAPDPHSRTPDHEGRRIEPRDGGWAILNHAKYRAKMSADDRREYLRIKQKEGRDRAKLPNDGNGTSMERKKGYVYYAGVGDLVKIGFSSNPWSRVWEFRTASPTIGLLAVEEGTMKTEKDRHAQFFSLRIEADREWFKLDGELKSHIERLVNLVSTNVDTHQHPSTPRTHQSRHRLPESVPAKRIAAIFHRALTTPWSTLEIAAFKASGAVEISAEDLKAVEQYYAEHWPPSKESNILRHDLKTFLVNLPGEIDRANAAKASGRGNGAHQWTAAKEPPGWRKAIQSRYPDGRITTWAALPDDLKAEAKTLCK